MKMIKELLEKYKEQILYLFFGVCTTAVNIIVYYVCDVLRFTTAVSTVIAWILSVLFAYVTNRKFVFISTVQGKGKIFKEGLRFFAYRAATGLLDLAIMIVFVDFLNFYGLLIKVLSNILVIVLNYIFSKLFIFKKV